MDFEGFGVLIDATDRPALASGLADSAPTLPPAAAQQRATWEGRIAERVWEYLLRDDPE